MSIQNKHFRVKRLAVAVMAAYPLVSVAAIQVQSDGYHAPFLASWLGVWAFAVAGGISAGFVRISDIDDRLYAPMFAKVFIGTFAGVSLCALVATGVEPPPAALTFWAYLASLCSAPIGAGLLVFISDQNRLNSIFSRASSIAQDRYLPPERKSINKKGAGNDADLH